ncbi:MAG: SMC family ATPase [Nitrososphaerota archaeon]|nr:SMC family ATPase [Nitrososphaerota archaeon]MDG6923248.1 SMC family ATPase [Nitrososphaerota archaeon]
MIVKRLKLENIRSYKTQVVDFPLGRTLFEGDIGTGKSTILMAIEFALFGLGSEKPGSLLKAGESEGSVSIIFESGGKDYMVERHLVKKRNSYNQDDCLLRSGDSHKYYSASEIKERILEILDFNEPPDPKAQSVIYRYAIYTPQEEIKNVLALKPDLRLQTLRKAFRIEDYKVATENAKNLQSVIKQNARDCERDAAEIPRLMDKISGLTESIEEKSKELIVLQKSLGEKKLVLGELKQREEKLQTERASLKAESGKMEILTSTIKEKKKEEESSRKRIGELEAKIRLNEPKIKDLQSRQNPTEKTLKELQSEIQQTERSEREFRDVESKIRAKLDDYESIMEEKICPTCDRPIETNTFIQKLNHKQSDLNDSHNKVIDCSKRLEALKQIQEFKRNYDQEQLTLKELIRSHNEYLEDLESSKSRNEDALKAVKEIEVNLESVRASIQKLQKVEAEINELKISINGCDLDLQDLSGRIQRDRTHIEDWEQESKETEKSLKKKQSQRTKAEKLNEYLIWIQYYFVPTLEAIEKQVLMNINLEFDTQFKKWFAMLVDDPGKEAKIDEDFTPRIQQDGIDQDVTYLSGGEKTSVALAYRLSLNIIVRKVSTRIQSNVLILDEPTDGFSKGQLGKVREILDELECPQIILVSHERELESFADQIFKVTKDNGVSTISSQS